LAVSLFAIRLVWTAKARMRGLSVVVERILMLRLVKRSARRGVIAELHNFRKVLVIGCAARLSPFADGRKELIV
jgi:hypothetical protein